MIFLFTFIFGAIIGSFLNVVIYRFNTGRGIGGRSMCFTCNRTLTVRELFPIFSFLFQKGRCSKCKTKLSWQYPAVELLTGLLFALSFQKVFPMEGFIFNVPFVWIIMSILVIITVYDLRHKIIPDQFSYLFATLTFIRLFISLNGNDIVFPSVAVLFAGPLLALPFYLIWMVSKGRWMGLGDAKLSLGLGWFLAVYVPTFSPLVSNISVFLYSFWIGTAFFILVSIFGFIFKKVPVLGLKSEIPFAPFLILGLLIVFLFRYNVASLIFNVYLN
jgi:prepilin signal peptidase PulO-like enzyme (type II secretory pathway)